MGHPEDYDSPDSPFNEFYEDRRMFDSTIQLCGRYGKAERKEPLAVKIWLEQLAKSHIHCKRNCGVKNTHLSWLTTKQLLEINPRLVIITQRNEDDTIEGYFKANLTKKWKKKPIEDWISIVKEGNEVLELLIRETASKVSWVRVNIPDKTQARMSREALIEYLDPIIKKYLYE
jgi:hypothetical protein